MTKYIYIELDLPIIHGCFNAPKDVEFPSTKYRKVVKSFSHEPTDIELETYVQTNYPHLVDVTKKLANIDAFRKYRDEALKKYDILRQVVWAGDIDPKTMLPYAELTTEEKLWRVVMLNFTDQITASTTEADYPALPERLR